MGGVRGPVGGQVSTVAPNRLDRQFDVPAPNTHWVTDITYIRTHEGWLYLAVVLDLYSRQVVGWAMQGRMQADLVLQALLLAVWRRKPARAWCSTPTRAASSQAMSGRRSWRPTASCAA